MGNQQFNFRACLWRAACSSGPRSSGSSGRCCSQPRCPRACLDPAAAADPPYQPLLQCWGACCSRQRTLANGVMHARLTPHITSLLMQALGYPAVRRRGRFADSPGWPLVQVPETARLAIEAVQDGYAVVIGLQSTGEARPASGALCLAKLCHSLITGSSHSAEGTPLL